MADSLESPRQYMGEEPLDELASRETHGALPAARRIGPHPEHHLAVLDAEDALVGDRHPVRVAAQILQHLRRATEGCLA